MGEWEERREGVYAIDNYSCVSNQYLVKFHMVVQSQQLVIRNVALLATGSGS